MPPPTVPPPKMPRVSVSLSEEDILREVWDCRE